MSKIAVACLCLLGCVGVIQAEETDYLTPALRARVEKLKVDVATVASNPTNLEERARILWDWGNAYALSGGVLPVNLTRAVALVFAYPDMTEDKQAMVDGFIDEMTLLDEQPTSLGTLRADTGPFETRSFATIRQTYTVGSRPIQTGGGILVARHFQTNFGLWQTSQPKADNYISVQSTAANVSFTSDSVPMLGMHGGIREPADALVFRVASGMLQTGDQVTITYGDRSQGSRGLLMPDFSSDLMPLPLYVAFTGNGRFYTLPIQPVTVTGSKTAGVHGFAPSIVAAGEPFTIAVRAQDAHGNRASGRHPRWKVFMNGEPFSEIPASDTPITLLREIELEQPGIYRFTLESRDGRIHGAANPVLVKAQVTDRIFWGDSHGHSSFGDGVGTPAGYTSWARDDAYLDFVAHSEHDVWLDDAEWETLRTNARTYTRQGEFIAFLGYEWTLPNTHGGHHNVLFRTAENRDRVSAQFYPTLSMLYAGLRASADPRDVLVIPHAHQAGDYRHSDPQLEHLVEILSQQGTFEWLGGRYLGHGHQIGFIAASDTHRSRPGYNAPENGSLAQRGGLGAVLAAEKTSDALFDAMRAGRTYATSGARIIVDFSVNGAAMGQRAAFSKDRLIRGQVVGTAPIDRVTLVKNDEEIWHKDLLTEESDKLKPQETLLLTFSSASQPLDNGDNPRGWRHWRGTIEIDGAELVAASGQDFHNQGQQMLRQDADDPNLLRFATLTRGGPSAIVLTLGKVKRSTTLKVKLEPALETGDDPPLYRPPQELGPAEASLSFRDMQGGTVAVNLPADMYTDQVTLRRIIANGEMQTSFEFVDTSERQGDYYFMRVRQIDDGLAWSSPIWVGGYPAQ